MGRKVKQTAPGKMVTVKGNKMHVYAQGKGDNTFVFMSGSGTRYPMDDFKPLWSLLVKDNQIAVVDKAGYGWSEVTVAPRDIDTILEETREALKLSGIKPPYILVPHSLSGLEALYWGQKYPGEVKAIMGLDPAIPDYYEQAKLPSMGLIKCIAWLTGYKIITPDMVNEARYVMENARKIKTNPRPVDIPTCFFISNGKGVAVKNWEEMLVSYLEDFKNKKHISLGCGHYVHKYESEKIAADIIKFCAEIH